MTSSTRQESHHEAAAFEKLLNPRTTRPRSETQQLSRTFRYCDTDQRLELLKTLLGQATDGEARVLREGYRTRRRNNGRTMKRMSYPVASKCSRLEKSREAWQVLEGCFFRQSAAQTKCRTQGTQSKVAKEEGLNGILKLDPLMVDGLQVLFAEHEQYLGKLCTTLGLEVGTS